MKAVKLVAVALLCLLFSAGPAFAASPHGQHDGNSQPLTLGLGGLVTNAGTQHYELSGGKLVSGSFMGNPLSAGHLGFSLDATVQGFSISGEGSLKLSTGSGENGHHDGHDGSNLNNGNNGGDENNGNGGISLQISITGAVPAAIFPLTSTGNCVISSGTCNSEIPLLFTGVATFDSGNGGAPGPLPIGIESAYWSPFHGPIVITSLDDPINPTLFLVVTYDEATIHWSGVQLQGEILGTFGTESVSGGFVQTTDSFENLVTGHEFDRGTIAFAMSDPALTSQGFFIGHSSFDLTNSFDCTQPPLSLPLPPGTCTATGLTSDGFFHMENSQDATISGSYHTVWTVPALSTTTTVSASVCQH